MKAKNPRRCHKPGVTINHETKTKLPRTFIACSMKTTVLLKTTSATIINFMNEIPNKNTG